jgi:predicted RNA-binding protein with PIN domain
MTYLIDGYNLLHKLGLAYGPYGGPTLDRARRALLARLAAGHGTSAASVTVVFDAHHPPPRAADEQQVQGVNVRFARHASADDLIEDLIRTAPTPKLVTVVSDDHRIQNAARRRGCVCQGCADYLDALDRSPKAAPPAREGDTGKPDRVSPGEAAEWLRAFGGDAGADTCD